MPLTFGGGITTVEMARKILKSGADKFSINTKAIKDPLFIKKCANEFGSQSVVVSIDCKKNGENYSIYINNGRDKSEKNLLDWLDEVQKLGAGEILINSIERDGTGKGYDYKLAHKVVSKSKIPVIILGGAKNINDFEKILKYKPSGIAAANVFQFTELSYRNIKKKLYKDYKNIRYEY